jgi:hypothetical protein
MLFAGLGARNEVGQAAEYLGALIGIRRRPGRELEAAPAAERKADPPTGQSSHQLRQAVGVVGRVFVDGACRVSADFPYSFFCVGYSRDVNVGRVASYLQPLRGQVEFVQPGGASEDVKVNVPQVVSLGNVDLKEGRPAVDVFSKKLSGS